MPSIELNKSNHHPMKKVNPEDLVVGQECYIKVVTEKVKISDRSPVLRDIAGNFYYPSRGEPIYTIDDQPQKPDPEAESALVWKIIELIKEKKA